MSHAWRGLAGGNASGLAGSADAFSPATRRDAAVQETGAGFSHMKPVTKGFAVSGRARTEG